MVKDEVNSLLGIAKYADSVASVGEFPWLENPSTGVSSQIFDDFLPIEAGKMQSFGNFVMRVSCYFIVVINHIFVKQLFVRNLPVIVKVVWNN